MPSNTDLKAMRDVIKNGGLVLYHFAGHYSVIKGYQKIGKGENDFKYIFYDPAGDRTHGYYNDSGRNAVYSQRYLQTQPIRGNAWGVEK